MAVRVRPCLAALGALAMLAPSAATVTATPAFIAPAAASAMARHDIPATPRLAADTDGAAASAFIAAARLALPRAAALSVTVWRGSQLLGWSRSGTAMNGRGLSAAARFRIASLSKLVTAATVLRLAELGKIDLDRPLLEQWHAPVAPRDARLASATVRQFLMHISGLGEQWPLFFVTRTGTWRNAAEELLRVTLDTAPGTHYEYSNGNYVILGRLIEAVTGQSYQAAAQRLVLGPLGITTAIMVGTAQRPATDPRYTVSTTRRYMERLGPAGAWAMSATDVRKLAQLRTTTGRALLGPGTIAAMRQPGPPTEYPYRYGLGLMLFNRGGWGHTGTIEAGRAIVVNFPNGITAVVVASVGSAPVARVTLERLGPALDRLQALPG